MNLVFLEKVNEDGSVEITIKEGAEGLRKVIDDKFVFPEKLVLTAEQKEENKEGLRDLLTGAFCFQEIGGVSFTVVNDKGELIADYMRSLYDELADIEVPQGFDASGAAKGGGGHGGHSGDGGGGSCSH